MNSRVMKSAQKLAALGAKSEKSVEDLPIASLPLTTADDLAVIEVEPVDAEIVATP